MLQWESKCKIITEIQKDSKTHLVEERGRGHGWGMGDKIH